jgi:hypothetical protein
MAGDNDERPGDDKPKKTAVAEYLASPRRKRKSFVVVACSPAISQEIRDNIDAFVRSTFKGVSVAMPASAEELVRYFARQIVLLVFDDEFASLEIGLELIREMKRKKNAASTPVLFLTRRPRALVEAYNRILLPYHESDDYLEYVHASMPHILSRIRTGLANKNKRRSRRYKIDLPVEYFDSETEFKPHFEPLDEPGVVLRYDLSSGQEIEIPPTGIETPDVGRRGRLVDLSLHGAMLRSEDGRLFRAGDQIKLKLSVLPTVRPEDSEFLKLSAKVQRVFIGGSLAGISFENMSDKQLLTLTMFLTEIVNQQNIRRAQQMRARAAAAK